MNEHELIINKISQGLIQRDEGVTWFRNKTEKEQLSILRSLHYVLVQSHPTKSDIENGVQLSGVKSTYSPCVVMLKKPFKEACGKIFFMQPGEFIKTFVLWLSIIFFGG